MYKAKNSMLPDCCLHHVHIAIQNTRYNFRVTHDFENSTFRPVVRQKYIAVVGCDLWNALPSNISLSPTIATFK